MANKQTKAEEFVLDGSIALAWCFHDEKDAYADAIAGRFPTVQAIVPSLWPLEVGNALLMGERRKRSSHADTANWLAFLSALAITIDHETTAQAWGNTLDLARSHNLSVYDAAYLELSLRQGLPLATLDNKLRAASKVVGVPLYKP